MVADEEADPSEVLQGGGRLTTGVVKIGETVRRPKSAFTRTLLLHLARAGFDGVPEYLGRDELDRDILTFLQAMSLSNGARKQMTRSQLPARCCAAFTRRAALSPNASAMGR